MAKEKRTFTPKFKMDAVRLVTEQGYKTTEAARNLGIHPSVLNKLKKQPATEGNNGFPGKGRLTPEKEELKQLRKENQRLKMERDFATSTSWVNG
jgi:transposase